MLVCAKGAIVLRAHSGPQTFSFKYGKSRPPSSRQPASLKRIAGRRSAAQMKQGLKSISCRLTLELTLVESLLAVILISRDE